MTNAVKLRKELQALRSKYHRLLKERHYLKLAKKYYTLAKKARRPTTRKYYLKLADRYYNLAIKVSHRRPAKVVRVKKVKKTEVSEDLTNVMRWLVILSPLVILWSRF